MKVLIWILTITIGSILNGILGSLTGIKFGAVLLYGIEVFIALKLCKLYDKKRQIKQDQKETSIVEDNKGVFFDKCLDMLQKKSAELGFYKSVFAIPPEIIRLGSNSVTSILKDSYYRSESPNNPKEQYFSLMNYCLNFGFIAASKSKNNSVEEELSSIILNHSIDEEAQKLLKKLFDNNSKIRKEEYSEAIFDTFLAMLKPYWNVKDKKDMQDYLILALTAVYQMGVSVSIGKL